MYVQLIASFPRGQIVPPLRVATLTSPESAPGVLARDTGKGWRRIGVGAFGRVFWDWRRMLRKAGRESVAWAASAPIIGDAAKALELAAGLGCARGREAE